MACGDVLSLEDLQTAKKHQTFEAEVITGKAGGVAGGAPIDYATNQVTGQTQKTLPAVLRDAGFRPAPFTFATGGTLAVGDSDMAVLWPVSGGGDGQYYIWKGAYPKTIPAASSPASTGGVSASGWMPLGDVTLRNDLASGAGGELVNFQISALNAALRSVSNRLSETVYVEDFIGADHTAKIQAAINHASSLGGVVEVSMRPGAVYNISQIVPKPGVIVNLRGATLLQNAGENRYMVYDGRNPTAAVPDLEIFAIINGVLDGNKSANNTSFSCGGVSLNGWSSVAFSDLKLKNIFAGCLTMNNVDYFSAKNIRVENCGANNSVNVYSYGLQFDNNTPTNSRFIVVDNMSVKDCYGFGVHPLGASNIYMNNLRFENLTMLSQAIAITLTECSTGTIQNTICIGVGGDNVEINACTDLKVLNTSIVNAGDVPLLFGDNNTGKSNQRVIIENFKATGTTGAFGAGINWVKDCEFSHMYLDKPVTTVATGGPAVNDRNNIFRDSTIAMSDLSAIVLYEKFHIFRCSFDSCYMNAFDGPVATVSNPQISGTFDITLPSTSTAYVPLRAIFGADITFSGFVCGRLKLTSWFNNQQSTYHEVLFMCSNNDTTLNLGTVTTLSNLSPRQMTISADAPNNRIAITNGTGATVKITWVIEVVGTH